MLKQLLLTIILCLLTASEYVFGRQLQEEDSRVLALLSDRRAFLSWHQEWEQHIPDLNLSDFQFEREQQIRKEHPRRIDSLGFHPLIISSPDGRRALNGWAGSEVYKKDGQYRLGFDDSDHMRLYDSALDTSYQVLFTGSYYPWIRGVAWLDDERFAAVGEVHDLSGPQDTIAPAVMIFDLDAMRIRFLVGKYVHAQDYHQKRRRPALILTEVSLWQTR
jgi:hypothetical protein